jgi:hypothetical protein
MNLNYLKNILLFHYDIEISYAQEHQQEISLKYAKFNKKLNIE